MDNNKLASLIEQLINTITMLQCPKNGSEWHKEQTSLSLIPYLIEESHEVTYAIRQGNSESIKDELGDLLFQIFLHAGIGKNQNQFTLEEIIENLINKLIKRHPEVFNTSVKSHKSWDLIKQSENSFKASVSPITDSLKRKIKSQPELESAMEISRVVANEGFEWESIDGIWDKVQEEIEEAKEALENKNNYLAEEELGDILFSLINVSRWSGIDLREGLARTNKKFLRRFAYIEKNCDKDINELSSTQLKLMWEEAKYNDQLLAKSKRNIDKY